MTNYELAAWSYLHILVPDVTWRTGVIDGVPVVYATVDDVSEHAASQVEVLRMTEGMDVR